MRKTILISALVLGGCQAWWPPWSEVTGNRYTATELNRRMAIIDQVDNQSSSVSNPIKIEPGEHRLVLLGPAPGWRGDGPVKVLTLDAQPCKRYYINAQFKDAITSEWTPVIDYVETISDCRIVTAQR
jgi:hypothetical protein